MTDTERRRLRQMHDRGEDVPAIAADLGLTPRSVAGYIREWKLKQKPKMPSFSGLVTVGNPEAYMRERGVWYGVDTRPAMPLET